MIKVECKRCLAVSVRKVMGRRHNRIDVTPRKDRKQRRSKHRSCKNN